MYTHQRTVDLVRHHLHVIATAGLLHKQYKNTVATFKSKNKIENIFKFYYVPKILKICFSRLYFKRH